MPDTNRGPAQLERYVLSSELPNPHKLTITAQYLQRSYPGQLPAVRRNANNIVVPVDLSSMEGVQVVINHIQIFVQNGIPVRFGLVPLASSPGSSAQLKVAHYLQETFGLASLMQFLEEVCGTCLKLSPLDLTAANRTRLLRRRVQYRPIKPVLRLPQRTEARGLKDRSCRLRKYSRTRISTPLWPERRIIRNGSELRARSHLSW